MQLSNLSIIIPVATHDNTWKVLLNELELFGLEPEIIIVGSETAPQETVLPSNVRWEISKPGRAIQMNTGARLAKGQVFWFVHSDTVLSRDSVESIACYLNHHRSGLAYFKLRFAQDGPLLTRLNAGMANLRSRIFKLPFGDQGFVIDTMVFKQLKGFDDTLPIGEDLDFIVRLHAAEFECRQLPGYLTTSARRYRQQGWLKTTLRHVWLTCKLTFEARQRLVIS
ncbi:MAG: glycosyltransferase family 2 protein [Gammaproteobacteria bacterium]|nr:glycosyltransferase family 2 protein [Gammaproteobacteria bacterium]